MAARVFEHIAFLVSACLSVVSVQSIPTAPFHESACPYKSDGPSCVSSNDEDSSCILIAFLQMGVQVNNSAVKKGAVMKSAEADTRVLDARSRASLSGLVTQPAMASYTQVRQIIHEPRQASMTSGGRLLVVIVIVVLAMYLAVWLTLPEDDEEPYQSQSQLLRLTRQVLDGSSYLQSQKTTGSNLWAIEEVVPICQQLILQKSEVRFHINMGDLRQLTEGSKLEIKGTSGRILLNATLVAQGASRVLQICVGSEDDLRATVKATPGEEKLVLCGKSEEPYGTIESIPDSSGSVLKYNGVPVMIIEKGDPTGLEMRAVSFFSKRELARAGQVACDFLRPMTQLRDQWKVNVIPGADAVLIASCMLGIMLLRDGVNRPLVTCGFFGESADDEELVFTTEALRDGRVAG